VSGWTPDELGKIERADELRVSTPGADGALRPAVTIWFARVGDDVYVRSAHRPASAWFRRAQASGVGHVSVGGVEKDVTFAAPDAGVHPALDAALHAKYDRYGPGPVGSIVGPDVADVTLRVDAR
jgi:hypothetical protein